MDKSTFGVYTTVSNAYSAKGDSSITLYTARGDSMFGRSLSAYWSLTPDEARELGIKLLEAVGRVID